jgi:restriction system protein
MAMPFHTTHVEAEFNFKSFFVGRTNEIARLQDYFHKPHQSLVLVTGERGSGKTALLKIFCETIAASFPGGIEFTSAQSHLTGMWQTEQQLQRKLKLPLQSKALWVIDDISALPGATLPNIAAAFDSDPLLNGLLASTRQIELPNRKMILLKLGSLSLAEFEQLFWARMKGTATPSDQVKQLWKRVQGNAAMAMLAGKTIREGLVTWERLFSEMADFEWSGLFGPDGLPLSSSAPERKSIITCCSQVNDELLAILKKEPNILRQMTSRKFEELVAELLSRKGFKVELTPPSKDGGFDMYAAKSDTLGRFLFLVECKRYSQTNKVGVNIVRALHGVVQDKKANAGVVVTTSFFTAGAKEFQDRHKFQLHLHDYLELRRWLGISP